MKDITELKKELIGISKEEKIQRLSQRIVNIQVSLSGFAGNNKRDEETLKLESLQYLLGEIEKNPEGYESKISDKNLIPFIYDRNLDWFFSAKNIPNQNLVFETIEYFDDGARKDFFKPLDFLNLLWAQYEYVKNNRNNAYSTLTHLKELPLNPEQKHVLFGFILKWYGGYPVENLDKQFDTALRLIEREFLSYVGETPEKKFCQRNWVEYSRLKKIEVKMNNSINGKETNSEYDFVKVKEYLKNIPDIQGQILFLTELQTEYRQNKTGLEFDLGTPFDEQCELEIKKLDKILKVEQTVSNQAPQLFKLSQRKGAKTDLIRILNAIYELKLIDKADGLTPSKQEFFEALGNFLGTDLSKYHSNLSQAFKNQPVKVNLLIFDEMIKITQNAHSDNQ